MVTIEDLVIRIKKSDRKAFNELFELLWEPIYAYACSILMDKSLAKDMVQDVWMDLWQRRNDVEIHHVKAYFYKAIRYRCYNHLRGSKLNKTQLNAADAIQIASETEQNEDAVELYSRVEHIISGLPQRCQEIFRLSRINNLENKEIAQKLDISQRSVENQISFALRSLRKQLTEV